MKENKYLGKILKTKMVIRCRRSDRGLEHGGEIYNHFIKFGTKL